MAIFGRGSRYSAEDEGVRVTESSTGKPWRAMLWVRSAKGSVVSRSECLVCTGREAGSAGRRSNRKGCDFGYALAADSCEGATGVDACTVTALGAITAFAVPDPG